MSSNGAHHMSYLLVNTVLQLMQEMPATRKQKSLKRVKLTDVTNLCQLSDVFMLNAAAELTRWLGVCLTTEVVFIVVFHTREDGRLVVCLTDNLRPPTIGQPLESTSSANS